MSFSVGQAVLASPGTGLWALGGTRGTGSPVFNPFCTIPLRMALENTLSVSKGDSLRSRRILWRNLQCRAIPSSPSAGTEGVTAASSQVPELDVCTSEDPEIFSRESKAGAGRRQLLVGTTAAAMSAVIMERPRDASAEELDSTAPVESIESSAKAIAAAPAEDTAVITAAAVQEATPGASSSADVADGGSSNPKVTQKVFFDISVDAKPVGRIVVGLYGEDVPIGAKRFAEVAQGKKGISYRRKEFMKITSHYLLNTGVRSFSLTGGEDDSAQFTGGETSSKLLEEMTRLSQRPQGGLKNERGTVSLVAFDPFIPPPKTKLIARNGSLVTVEEVAKAAPNGTEFAIAFEDAPELDTTNLVVGRVLDGWEVVELLRQVATVKENTSSPYFMAAKMIGDSRAVVAERGFNRPFLKVLITKCGNL